MDISVISPHRGGFRISREGRQLQKCGRQCIIEPKFTENPT